MKKIICLMFGHRAKVKEREIDYFGKNFIVTCVRCGYTENILEKINRYSNPFPIGLDWWETK